MITLLSGNVFLYVSFPSGRNLAFSSSPAHFTLRSNFIPISQTRLFSSSIDVAKEDSFTVSYLVNSCGLSPESAKLATKYFQFKDPSNPDSVLDCLRNYGFSDAHIKKVVRACPYVLGLNAEKILKPKMEFFLSIGVKAEDLAVLICRNPRLIGCSLNERIIPCYDFLKRELVHDELVVKSLTRGSRAWNANLEKNVVPKVELLKKVGVTESNIQMFLVRSSRSFALDNTMFSKRVDIAIAMGFDPSKHLFIEAIRCWPTESNWERKAQSCRSWGWSDSDISSAFRKNPNLMTTSVEKLAAVMDFLVNKMGCDPSVVAGSSFVFFYSLEKNIIPKCSVIRVLMLKGLIGEEITLGSFLPCDKKVFLDRFVFKYLEQVPELLDIYEGEVDLEELGYGFEEKLNTKLEHLAS